MNLIFFLSFLFILYIIIDKQPGIAFMVGLTVYFNIGGYLSRNTFGFPGFFSFHDFGLLIAVLSAFKAINFKIPRLHQDFRKLLSILLIFSLYQVFITIMFNLEIFSPFQILRQLFIHKWRIFGIFFAIPTYFIIQKYSKTIYKTIIWVTLIVLSLYFLTLFTPLTLIKIIYLERGFVQAVRTYFTNYGYIQMSIVIGLIVYLLKLRIDIKYRLYIASILMMITILITLTRGTTINMFGSILITGFILTKYFNVTISKTVIRSGLFMGVMIIMFGFAFPRLISGLFETYLITFREVTGQVARGTTQLRSEFELVTMWPLFLDNFLTGTGYLRDYFDAYGTKYELGLADIPLIGNLAIHGIIGFSIYLIRYFVIHKEIRKIFHIHKQVSIFRTLPVYDIVLFLWAIISFYTSILFTFFNFSMDLVYGGVSFGLLIGILYGILNKYDIHKKT